MHKLRQLFSTRKTPQIRPIPHTTQTPNSAGGYTWAITDWSRLDRFLILGSEGGSYYSGPRQLTVENAEAVIHCLQEDGIKVVDRVVEISKSGRAPKNDPALFVLAMAAGLGDDETRQAAFAALPEVARIGTHLFHFIDFVEGFRGWGRGLRRAVGDWYEGKSAEKLAYQVIKYQRRDGWSHRDVLRLAHPKAATEQHNAIYHWITQGWSDVDAEPHADPALRQIWAFEYAKTVENVNEMTDLIMRFNLPWEAIPTSFLADTKVWEVLLPNMGLTAMVRNLARMSANGLLAPLNVSTNLVVSRLADAAQLRKARVHPIQMLSALMTYSAGRGVRGKLTWSPVREIVDALNEAFYHTFTNVESTGKRFILGLDVSGSMTCGQIAGVPGLSPRVASAAMSLITAATEKQSAFMAFTGQFVPLNISPRQRLDDVVKTVSGLPFGRTDCALPMLWALENRVEADAFVIYTDSETYHGKIHPVQALRQYRQKMGIPAQLIVVGMVSNGFTIADPNDGGMMDVVGFDASAPRLMSDFLLTQ